MCLHPHCSTADQTQVETFECLSMLFASNGMQNKDINTQIGEANPALREPYCSVATKLELSCSKRISVGKEVFVPTLTCSTDTNVE